MLMIKICVVFQPPPQNYGGNRGGGGGGGGGGQQGQKANFEVGSVLEK